MNKQPKILLVTETAIDFSHGTGVQLIRVFGAYERGCILNVVPEGSQGGPFDCVSAAKVFENGLGSFALRLWNKLSRPVTGSAIALVPRFIPSSIEHLVRRFNPDVVLGVIYTNNGLALMKAALQTSRGSRAILWFHDLQLVPDRNGYVCDLREMLNSLTEIWALSPLMLDWLEGAVGGWPVHLRTRVRAHWCVPVTDGVKRIQRAYSTSFRCVMLGNVWDYRMISLAKQLWRECQIKVPGLGPIHWVCHESGVRRVASQGAKLGPEIEWQGEVAEDRLHDTLLKSDLAFVPFSANADSNYARFSIPSKLGELAAVGMPMVILAGSHTASAKYVTDYGVAELLTELTQNHWPKRLCEIIQSADERARLSTSARKYADRYLNQESFRTEIFDDLRAAAFGDARRNDGEREGTRSAAFGEIRS